MKQKKLALSALAALIAIYAGYAYATAPRISSVEDLGFNISLDRTRYALGETPKFTIELTNMRWYPIYLEKDFTPGRTVLISLYKNASRYATRVIPTTMTTAGCADFMKRDVNPYAQFTEVLILQPGEKVSITLDLGKYQWYNTDSVGYRIGEVEFIDWNAPGEYALEAFYVQRWCSRVAASIPVFWKAVGRIEFSYG